MEDSQFLDILAKFVNANLDEKENLIEHNPELLSNRAEAILKKLEMTVAMGEEPIRALLYRSHLALIHRCNEIGTRSAFSELVSAQQKQEAPPAKYVQLIVALQQLPVKNFSQRISLCKETISNISESQFPQYLAHAHLLLAQELRSPYGDEKIESIEDAIKNYRYGLKYFTQDRDPQTWAGINHDLALTYLSRTKGTRDENLEIALNLLLPTDKVELLGEHANTMKASLENTLGIIYQERVQGSKRENIERAILHLKQALKIAANLKNPLLLGGILDNLSKAHIKRITGDRAENLETALNYSTDSLISYTEDGFPKDWASVQDSLGNIYMNRLKGSEKENLSRAIVHFENALRVTHHERLPNFWSRIHNELALANMRLGNDQKTIYHFEQALTIRNKSKYPRDWAETMINMGIFHLRKDSITARKYLSNALEVFVEDKNPEACANIHHHLGISYLEDLHRNNQIHPDDVLKAINHFRLAAEFRNPLEEPMAAIKTGRAFGDFGLLLHNWGIADEGYSIAFQGSKYLYLSSITRESKNVEIAEMQEYIGRKCYALAQIGRLDDAVEFAESMRAQLLGEALEKNRIDLNNLVDLGYSDIYNEYTRESLNYQNLINSHDKTWDWQTQAERSQTKIKSIVEQIKTEAGAKYPRYRDFLEAPTFEQIKDLARNSPIIYIFGTPIGGCALIVTESKIDVIWLNELSDSAMKSRIKTIYFQTYLSRSSDWYKELEQTTEWIWNAIVKDIIKTLKHSNDSAVIIPFDLVALLPLHAALNVSEGKRNYALDEINISYSPSAKVLLGAFQQSGKREQNSLLAIDNPDESLKFSRFEIIAATSHFANRQCKVFHGKECDIETVVKAIPNYDILHFSTHGFAKFDDPLLSGLLVAERKVLSLESLMKMRLDQPSLVILSACETSIPSDLTLLNEVVSLASGFIQAGVPAVIGTLWSVADISTALLISRFYDLWQNHHVQPKDALRQSQIWLRTSSKQTLVEYSYIISNDFGKYMSNFKGDSDDYIFSHPFWWAGFTYNGCSDSFKAG